MKHTAYHRLKTVLLPAALMAAVSPLVAQVVPSAKAPPERSEKTAAVPTERVAASEKDDAIVLSPFEVSTNNDKGYFAENTLAGSRLNTSVADLANSITVVTKQQMLDTASIDINDIFLYEANTEGTGNFTDFGIDSRGAVQDRSAGYQSGAPGINSSPATANRVRGIGAVDKMRDYYPSNLRIPFDVYNTDSVEINRGPNSLLFGLGSAAGIVNQSSAKANLRKITNHVDFRVDDLGGFRAAFSVNRPLIENKLALYVSGLHDERGFQRKPAFDITQRGYAAFTAKPFEKTTIRGSFENYENRNRRPNSVTPRDFVSPWIAKGKPSYNPVTRMLTVNGVTTGPYDGSNGTSQLALLAASGNTIQFDGNNRPVQMIDQGNLNLWIMRQLSSTPTVAGTPAAFNFNSPIRATKSQGPWTQYNQITGLPAGIVYAQPGVTDKSVYDWESINILSANHGEDSARIYNIELEQEILPDLHLQVGWYREDFKSDVQYYLSQQTGITLYVDTNAVNVDGSNNPNFGRPFVETTAPDRFLHPEDNMTGRATLAYTADFTKRTDLLRWAGKHNLMALWQHNQVKRDQIRMRPYMSSNNIFTPVVADVWSGNTAQNVIERRYYVGGTNGRVTNDPGYFDNGSRTVPLRWFNPITGAWENTAVQEDEAMHFVSSRSKQEIKSRAASVQSYFGGDRIVTTFGWRHDESDARSNLGLTRNPAGLTDATNIDVFNTPQVVSGDTKSFSIVGRPFKWDFLKAKRDGGSFLTDTLRNVSLTYNESDNFAPAGQGTDFYGNFLPFPTGKGKDYGIGISLLDEKLVARINWFESSQNNARGALIAQAVSRTYTMDDTFFRAWAQLVTGSATNTSDAVKNVLKLPTLLANQPAGVFFNQPTVTTSTVDAEGLEFQLTYNPVRTWTMKFTAGKQETIYSAIGPEFTKWVAERLPIWQGAKAPAGSSIPDFWNATGLTLQGLGLGGFGLGDTQRVQDYWFTNVDSVVRTAQRNEGKVTQDQRKWRWSMLTNYDFVQGPMKGFNAGAGVRWEDKAAIGYRAGKPDADGLIRSLDTNQPIFDEAEYHVDLWLAYTFKGLPWIGDKVRTKAQLNVRDALENGGLKPIAVNPDGTPIAFRIVDPRQIYLSVAFDF